MAQRSDSDMWGLPRFPPHPAAAAAPAPWPRPVARGAASELDTAAPWPGTGFLPARTAAASSSGKCRWILTNLRAVPGQTFFAPKKLLQKQESGSKKPKKGAAPAPPSEEKKMNIGLIYEMNLKQVQKLCMPFIRFKKDEAREVGPQALDLKLPFGEMDVLRKNMELIRRQLGLEQVEVISASDEAARAIAGSFSA
ncbi:unnamed protein product [Urochloa humidicola]